MKKIEKPLNLEKLFSGFDKAMVRSCLEQTSGAVYAESENSESALAAAADFCFLAGKPEEKLVQWVLEQWQKEYFIIVPENEAWAGLIEKVFKDRARKFIRYAIKKEENVWDLKKLERIAAALPSDAFGQEKYELKMIDEALFEETAKHSWSADFTSQFADFEDYKAHGLGAAVLCNGELVSGASSYVWYDGGIEIEIDTKEEFRRRGLAAACGAKLILECVKRGLYPGWDAHNMVSLHLAEKLGYHRDKPYTAYEITKTLELERMIQEMKSGRLYLCSHEGLLKEQQACLDKLFEYNQLPPSASEQKNKILKELFAEIGEDCYIETPYHANWGGRNVHFGKGVYANFNLTMVDDGDIFVGDYVMFGPNVTLATAAHPISPALRKKQVQYNLPVVIGDNVWIGAGAVVLPGVTIGENSVIGAGSVVTKDIPANVVAVGNPCRIVREISQRDMEYYRKNIKIPNEI